MPHYGSYSVTYTFLFIGLKTEAIFHYGFRCQIEFLFFTASNGHASIQFPQCRQCSCRIVKGIPVISIHFCGHLLTQVPQPRHRPVMKNSPI